MCEVLSAFFFSPLGLITWILASSDLRKMAIGKMDPKGRNLIQIGRVFGIIAFGVIFPPAVYTVGWIYLMNLARGGAF